MTLKDLFLEIYGAATEDEIDRVVAKYPEVFAPQTGPPMGVIESNCGVVENQQAASVPALIEKIINSIDAES